MQWLFENPWPAIGCGLVLEAFLGVAFYNTGRRAVLAGMAGVLVLTLAMVAIEKLVVTEREEVEDALHGIAAAMETNRIEAVLAYIAPDAIPMRSAVQSILPTIEVIEAKAGGDIKIIFNRVIDPPTARVEFIGRVKAKSHSPGQQFPYENFIRRFTVKLRKEGDRWLLTEYEMGGEGAPQ